MNEKKRDTAPAPGAGLRDPLDDRGPNAPLDSLLGLTLDTPLGRVQSFAYRTFLPARIFPRADRGILPYASGHRKRSHVRRVEHRRIRPVRCHRQGRVLGAPKLRANARKVPSASCLGVPRRRMRRKRARVGRTPRNPSVRARVGCTRAKGLRVPIGAHAPPQRTSTPSIWTETRRPLGSAEADGRDSVRFRLLVAFQDPFVSAVLVSRFGTTHPAPGSA